ncbi:alpha/beta hydrolase-fold protein [Actinomycetaceae bacterium L2_0104]
MKAPAAQWTDRFGHVHEEMSAEVPAHEGSIPRVATPQHLPAGTSNPIVTECGDPLLRDFTWIVEAPDAHAVLLWANGMFNHEEVESSEFERVDGSDLWALTLRLPSSWRASYRIAVWDSPEPAPWRQKGDRFAIRTSALEAAALDPRAGEIIGGSHGPSCLAAGPDAPVEIWRTLRWPAAPESAALGTVHEHEFAAGKRYGEQRVWVYEPQHADATALLVLFDGQVWHEQLHLSEILDAAIAGGMLPPLHVAMVDSHDVTTRWQELGVPGGQVDFVLDTLLAHLRDRYDIRAHRDSTVVSGQSLGGIAAIWALALGGDQIGHAIAQSPSLWRFDMSRALRRNDDWLSLHLQAGRFEGDMLTHAAALRDELTNTAQPTGRTITLDAIDGGHDWAWWRAGLVHKLGVVLAADH